MLPALRKNYLTFVLPQLTNAEEFDCFEKDEIQKIELAILL